MSDDHPTVDLHVDNALLADFDKVKHLLGGTETGRSPHDDHDITTIHMAMPDAPRDAATMRPWFTRHNDGTVTVDHIDYYDNDGNRLT